MRNRISPLQISQKFRSMSEVPEWIKSGLSIFRQLRLIRRALGMTQDQLARRIKANQSDIATLEKDVEKDVQLSTLKRIADAMNCELLLTFVPKKEMTKWMEEKSLKKAAQIIRGPSANMAMELQKPNERIVVGQIKQTAAELLRKNPSILWEDHER